MMTTSLLDSLMKECLLVCFVVWSFGTREALAAPTGEAITTSFGGPARIADNDVSASCPSECSCRVAPLHDAPFVHMWLRNWAHTDLPDLAENDVLDESAVASAHGPAEDAGVDVTSHVLHVTCALYPDSNLKDTLQKLPQDTKVLSVLQAAGSNYTIVEGDQLASLSNLRALHIQGFEQHPLQPRQAEPSHEEDAFGDQLENRHARTLSMALSDDALMSLVNLEILDLEFVRLVAKGDTERSRRHIVGPVSTTTMVDMPLRSFLRYADEIDSVQLPRDLKNNQLDLSLDDEIVRNGNEIGGDYEDFEANNEEELNNEPNEYEKKIKEELSVILLDGTEDDGNMPHTAYKTNANDFFAPFMSQNSLKYLRIANAHLDDLGPELLGGLTNLHTFTLEYNHIRVLPAHVFTPTPNIRHLSIAHNSLLSLESTSFHGLNNLVTLDLEHNKLTIIGSGSFPHLPKLRSLKLEGNPLKHILPDSFRGVNATDALTLGSHRFPTKIHDDALRHLSSLKLLRVLNISSESFREGLFSGVPQLEDLTLHGNISVIDFDAFTSIDQLKYLDISHCALTRISVDAFFGLTNLVRLDMSHNNIHELNPGVFDHLSSLSELYLQHNQLTTLSVGLFTPMSLRVLRLNHNPWECTCNLLQLHPTVTNSAVHNGYNICRLDSKMATVCERVGRRTVFDVRVAPKCTTPHQYRNKDVYTVADRYLKCSKYHWDPLVYTEKPQSDSSYPEKVLKPQISDASGTNITEQNGPDDGSDASVGSVVQSWKPLAAYTPAPIKTVDLLSIAESDRLEEAPEDTTPHPSTRRQMELVLHDQTTPLNKEEHKRRLADSRAQYIADKNKLKHQLRVDRAREVQRLLKRVVWDQKTAY